MDPQQFIILENNILTIIPKEGISFSSIISKMTVIDESGYGKRDTKSAIISLKAKGKIELTENGIVYLS